MIVGVLTRWSTFVQYTIQNGEFRVKKRRRRRKKKTFEHKTKTISKSNEICSERGRADNHALVPLLCSSTNKQSNIIASVPNLYTNGKNDGRRLGMNCE